MSNPSLAWSVTETLQVIEINCHLVAQLIAQAIAMQNLFDLDVFGSVNWELSLVDKTLIQLPPFYKARKGVCQPLFFIFINLMKSSFGQLNCGSYM